jgi:hypothetical protein
MPIADGALQAKNCRQVEADSTAAKTEWQQKGAAYWNGPQSFPFSAGFCLTVPCPLE